jgi:hypothetical protein
MKNIYVLLAAAFIPAALAAKPASVKPSTPIVSAEAQSTIATAYPDARNLQWDENTGAVFTAYFYEAGDRTVANVSDAGDIISVLTYYTPRHTPASVRSELAKKYPGMAIAQVTKYEQDGGNFPEVIYQASMEDADHWYIVTVYGKEVHTKQVLNKA